MALEDRLGQIDMRLRQLLAGFMIDPTLTKVLQRVKDPYWYRAQFLPLAASATAIVEFTIQTGYDFVCMGANAVVTDTSDATIASTASAFDPFNPPFLVTIRHTGPGQNITNAPIAFANIFGTARDPYFWPIPKIFPERAVVQTTLENLVATDRRIRLAYFGFHAEIGR